MTQTYNCSAGHQSVDADFCSECGNQLAAPLAASAPSSAPSSGPASGASAPVISSAAALASASSTSGSEDCPKCSESRDGSAQFCGVCGYDYVTMTGGEVPQATPPAAPPSYAPPAVTAPLVQPPASSARIDVEVVVNKGSVRKHSLFDAESLIGRPNNKLALSLVIDGDEGISRRQMMITRQAASVTLRDLDSANGTKVDRGGTVTTLAAGEERELAVGDKIIIGEYTVVTIVAINL